MGWDGNFLPNRTQIFVRFENYTKDGIEEDQRYSFLRGNTHMKRKSQTQYQPMLRLYYFTFNFKEDF